MRTRCEVRETAIMRLHRTVVIAFVVFAIGLAGAAAQQRAPSAAAQEKTLYQRLGGYDTLADLVDDVGGRFATDDQLKRFFRSLSKDSLARQRQLVLDLICDLAGGPCVYIGRDLKTAHFGLGVSPSDWTRAMGLLGETLVRFNIGERERKDVLALIASLEPQIVEK
jgi:hemoglobin